VPTWHEFPTSDQLDPKFQREKCGPSWSQLTSGQVDQKLTAEKVPNLGTFLKARVRWEMVSNLDTIYFWPSWPEVDRKWTIGNCGQLGHN
jgi:hypothetical protein